MLGKALHLALALLPLLLHTCFAAASQCERLDNVPCACELDTASGTYLYSLKDVVEGLLTTEVTIRQGVPGLLNATNFKVFFAPCAPLEKFQQQIQDFDPDCSRDAICVESGLDFYPLGRSSFYSEGGQSNVRFVYPPAIDSISKVYRRTMLELVCIGGNSGFRGGQGMLSYVNQTGIGTKDSPYTFLLKYEGVEACGQLQTSGNDKPHKLSAGSVLLILFFVLVVVYFAGGLAYNTFFKGAVGLQRIPNQRFWIDLPFLIKDGVVFTYTCGCCQNEAQADGYDNI